MMLIIRYPGYGPMSQTVSELSINIGVFLLWVVVLLAIALLRVHRETDARPSASDI
jgi:hypothetical protein